MPKPLRLLSIITDSGIGGTEKVLLSLLKNLPRDRIVPTSVLVLKSKRDMAPKWEATGVPVFAAGMNHWPTPATLGAIRAAIDRDKPDLVHAFLYHSIQTARLARIIKPAFKLISSPRVNYRFAPWTALAIDRFLKNRDTLTLCESEAGKKSLVKSHGYDENKVRVAWTSVDRYKFTFDPAARERLRTEWGVAADEILIGSVGRLHTQKGFDLLIEALRHMKGVKGKFTCVVAGAGPEKAALEAKAVDAPIRFIGERSDVTAVMSAFDVYVQSSRYEGLSNALLEAMSIGRACAATAVDGTLDFAKDGENLVLVRPNDAASLAIALGTLVEKPSLRAHLSENAKITASTFSLERMIQGFVDAYELASRLS